MRSKGLFIGIGIVIGLAVGLGVGFGFSSTFESGIMDMQSIRQIMTDNPKTIQEMIMSNMRDSDQMVMMEDMMDDMMQRMQTDPELEQAMMEHMANMKASRDVMMGSNDSMMKDMNEK